MSRRYLTKNEKREHLNFKEKFAPQGATLADEVKQIKSNKGYVKQKSKKKDIKRITIRISAKG